MTETDSAQLHAESIIIDGLNASNFTDVRVFQRLHQGGVTAVNATIAAWHTMLDTINLIADIYPLFERHADLIMQVHRVKDIETAKATNRVGVILGFQDSTPIDDNIRLLGLYHRLGVRIIQLTYNTRNLVGSGCIAPQDEGLTKFGYDVVAEMNQLGILIDVSHCGPRTTLEAIEASARPVAITHSNARATLEHPRNKTDEVIKAMAAKGGVIGAVAFPAMLTREMPATLGTYIAAIDYLVELVGVDHVGLGPDFMEEMTPEVSAQALKDLPPHAVEEFKSIPPTQNFASVSEFPNVTRGLLERGYSTEDVRKIVGGNWLRLYRQVWQS